MIIIKDRWNFLLWHEWMIFLSHLYFNKQALNVATKFQLRGYSNYIPIWCWELWYIFKAPDLYFHLFGLVLFPLSMFQKGMVIAECRPWLSLQSTYQIWMITSSSLVTTLGVILWLRWPIFFWVFWPPTYLWLTRLLSNTC